MTFACRWRRFRPFSPTRIPVVEATIPGARPIPFGHMGDGNIHFNVSQPLGADKQAYLGALGRIEREST